MTFLALMAIAPILVVFVMLIRNVSTLLTSIVGWSLCVLSALIFFDTSISVSLRASLATVFQSFPFTLMIISSILLITFMESTGAIRRISVFIKTLAPTNQVAQLMTINLGVGTTLVSVGATPVSILPPIMKSKGYSNFMSIALPGMGYDALCTYSMLAAPLVVYSDIAGISLVEAAKIFALYLPAISTGICFGMLYLAGGTALMKKGFRPALISGLTAAFTAIAIAYIPFLNAGIVLTGVIAGGLVLLVNILMLKLKGVPIIDRSVLNEEDLQIEKGMSLFTALSPITILIVSLLFVNFVKPVNDLLMVKLAMPISIIPGQEIKLRMLWNAYTFMVVSVILSAICIKPTKSQIKETLSIWLKRFPTPFITATVFFALALLMSNTGLEPVGSVWKVVDPTKNMISVFAMETARIIGAAYPFITAPLGLFGSFVSSSEGSTLAMFAKYNIIAAEELGLNALVVTAGTGIGAGLGSLVAPGKLQNAAAVIDAIGEEQAVLKKLFPICLVLVALTSVVCFILTKIIT